MPRSCGGCTVCCVVPSISEIGKPKGKACPNLGKAPHACTIYKDRPLTCRTFQCGWITNEDLPSRFRPDRCGFMLVGRQGGKIQVWELEDTPYKGSRFERAVSPRLRDFSEVEIVRT
jgi:Fe-S-cluster containining protein